MFKKSFYTFCLILALAGVNIAQTTQGLAAHYTFDDCAVTDDTGNTPDGLIFGNPECGCGPEGNALFFDGTDDYVDFQNDVGTILSGDFTASFYIQPQNITGLADVFSRRTACRPDSAVSIRYEADTRRIRCELSEGIDERAEIDLTLPEGDCWFHVTWVREDLMLFLYLNGQLVQEERFFDQIDATNQGTFSIANSPCLGSGERRFRGGLDDLRIYDRALSAEEIAELPVVIDRLISMDTIVFRGQGMQIRLTNSCAPNYEWVPGGGVSDQTAPEPFIAPDETTTYTLTMNYGFCQSRDTVRIIVVDSADLDCNDVFLPNAFTPNQDGLNDEFGLSNGNFFLGDFISLEIYDRWASKVFESSVPQDTWDGTINGEDAMPGIFIYKVRYLCNGEERITRGSFNLLR